MGESQGQVRVLVVDDDAAALESTSTMLQLTGFDVRGAQNGALGLEQVLTFRPEVVVFDFWMPVSDGRALLQGIREVFRERVGLVAMSGTPEVEDWCSRVGVTHFVRKPFEKPVLVDTVHRALEEARTSSARTRVAPTAPPSSRKIPASRAVMLVGQREVVRKVTSLLRESERPMVVAVVPGIGEAVRALESFMLDVVAVVGDITPEDRASLPNLFTETHMRGLPVVIDARPDLDVPSNARISLIHDATASALAEAIQVAAGVVIRS